MTNLAKFNASKIKLYGATQVTEGTAETLAAGNAIIAMNLSYDENIASKTDTLTGGTLDRNAITSISDRFGEVSFDTYLPYLGAVTGTTEIAEITFTPFGSNTLFAATNTFTVTLGSDAFTATYAAASTLAQAVDETVAYINDGTAGTKFTFATSAGTGRVGIRAAYIASNGAASTDGKVVLTSVTASKNVANITIGGTAGRATLAVTEGITSTVQTIPLAPFLESSSLAQTITYKKGMPAAIRLKYTNAASKLVLGISSGSATTAALTTAINEVTILKNLFRAGDAGRAQADTLIANLTTLKTNVISAVWGATNSLKVTQNDVEAIVNHFDNSVLLENYTTAVSTLITDTDTALATITAVQSTKTDNLSNHATWGVNTLKTYIENASNLVVSWTTTVYVTKAEAAKTNAKVAINAAKTAITAIDTYATLTTGSTSTLQYLTSADTAIATYTTANLIDTGIKSLSFSNTAESNATCTYHIRKPSIDLTSTEKTVVLKDVRSTIDLNIAIGERPMVKVNAHGNIDTTTDETSFTYDIVSQKTAVADVTTSANLVNASITPTGTATYNNNVCFQKLSISNFDGFTHTRTQTGCGNFWLPEATAYDFTMTILEDSATADGENNFNPVESINKEFTVVVKQGTESGKRFTITLTQCTLKGFKNTTSGNIATQDLTFSMSGRATLLLD